MIDLLPLVAAASSVAEYPAARMMAFAIQTQPVVVDARTLWPALRVALGKLARDVAQQARTDALLLTDEDAAILRDYAADLEGCALDFEREDVRQSFANAKELMHRFGKHPSSREIGLSCMRAAWAQWLGLADRESYADRIKKVCVR